ncbi:Smr/MutS family protein [Palleronia sp. LCG004]|uniref:Smr/MutS family protein n=1 Tax=Palleronia sp. LCG004 TaxID=3079304 RepID=UPI002943C54A|nr:Smr/MutS family protein [Palleronia sp. LCG004]WOI55931.1 Smr/MutS family protein [Palleronia sp. LCG004]
MSRRKGPRGLRPDERELWSRIARQTVPLHPERRAARPAEARMETPARAPAAPGHDLKNFAIGQNAPARAPGHDLIAPLSDRLSGQPVAMDAKAYGRMKRGKLGIEGRIDLHGLTLSEAHPRLVRFILDAHGAGKRLVLVITGKGRERDIDAPMPVRRGALRHQVPQWLNSGPLRSAVLQIAEAHRSHGGSGAFYVYLRRAGK